MDDSGRPNPLFRGEMRGRVSKSFSFLPYTHHEALAISNLLLYQNALKNMQCNDFKGVPIFWSRAVAARIARANNPSSNIRALKTAYEQVELQLLQALHGLRKSPEYLNFSTSITNMTPNTFVSSHAIFIDMEMQGEKITHENDDQNEKNIRMHSKNRKKKSKRKEDEVQFKAQLVKNSFNGGHLVLSPRPDCLSRRNYRPSATPSTTVCMGDSQVCEEINSNKMNNSSFDKMHNTRRRSDRSGAADGTWSQSTEKHTHHGSSTGYSTTDRGDTTSSSSSTTATTAKYSVMKRVLSQYVPAAVADTAEHVEQHISNMFDSLSSFWTMINTIVDTMLKLLPNESYRQPAKVILGIVVAAYVLSQVWAWGLFLFKIQGFLIFVSVFALLSLFMNPMLAVLATLLLWMAYYAGWLRWIGSKLGFGGLFGGNTTSDEESEKGQEKDVKSKEKKVSVVRLEIDHKAMQETLTKAIIAAKQWELQQIELRDSQSKQSPQKGHSDKHSSESLEIAEEKENQNNSIRRVIVESSQENKEAGNEEEKEIESELRVGEEAYLDIQGDVLLHRSSHLFTAISNNVTTTEHIIIEHSTIEAKESDN